MDGHALPIQRVSFHLFAILPLPTYVDPNHRRVPQPAANLTGFGVRGVCASRICPRNRALRAFSFGGCWCLFFVAGQADTLRGNARWQVPIQRRPSLCWKVSRQTPGEAAQAARSLEDAERDRFFKVPP